MGSALSVWEYFLCWEIQTLYILAYILLGSFPDCESVPLEHFLLDSFCCETLVYSHIGLI